MTELLMFVFMVKTWKHIFQSTTNKLLLVQYPSVIPQNYHLEPSKISAQNIEVTISLVCGLTKPNLTLCNLTMYTYMDFKFCMASNFKTSQKSRISRLDKQSSIPTIIYGPFNHYAKFQNFKLNLTDPIRPNMSKDIVRIT